ncbi:6-phosphogluconolactonase [Deinobacterium chartae]|uniref:6-phosphogluconolactonase n=1 Tax=Deinobacterium chartae TaxID=521158 RepID=A0A841I2A6_9DEIO|nr:6-phosphogluconolactonase [Deinobacterium chartae]MBB6099196.1 6-phosphogluconolactonase [Deinobacterium chartae]
MRYEVFETPEALGQGAADLFESLLLATLRERDRFRVALSGGSTPLHLYRALRGRELPWERVEWYWSDERTVGPDSKDSNYRLAHDELLAHLPASGRVERIPGEIDPHEAARRYAEVLPESIDLCYLGMGDDGHTASLFPGTEGLAATGRVTANFVPRLGTWRVSFTFEEINRAHNVQLLVTGQNKASVLAEVRAHAGKHPVERVKDPLWLLDREAASQLA